MKSLSALINAIAIAFCFLCLGLTASARAELGSECTIADEALPIASRLRELAVKHSVSCRLENQQEVEKYIREAITKKIPAGRIANEERVYKLLGVMPAEYAYLEGIVALYTSQLGGYYDPEGDYYAMASWIPNLMQLPIAVHELTHALQNQYFDLEKFTDIKLYSSDTLLARSALVEGDATAVMLDYSRMLSGQGRIAKANSVGPMMIQSVIGAMFSPSLSSTPAVLQAQLLFPYISGLNFVHALLKRGGFAAIDEVYISPPTSTSEILHPDLYINRQLTVQNPEKASLPMGYPQLPEGLGVYHDTLGEFFISTMLAIWAPRNLASSAAAGWVGDLVVLYESSNSPGVKLFWDTRWGNESEAKEFFSVFSESYRKRGIGGSCNGSSCSFEVSAKEKVDLILDSTRVLYVVSGL